MDTGSNPQEFTHDEDPDHRRLGARRRRLPTGTDAHCNTGTDGHTDPT